MPRKKKTPNDDSSPTPEMRVDAPEAGSPDGLGGALSPPDPPEDRALADSLGAHDDDIESPGGPDLFGESPLPSVRAESAAPEGTYVVLARRYRPQTFDDLVGQDHVREALRQAIRQGQIAHAYLFSGPRGTGKTSTARILAKALNCQTNGPRPDPCGRCPSCRAIATGQSLDVIEIDAASNTGVDNIRDLRTGVVLAPFSRYKVYIVDEVHMLSLQAFNALLKTLEEPPPKVVFVLATTELHKVPQTIISRCQCFQFRRFTVKEIVAHLDGILTTEAQRRGIQVAPDEKRRVLELIAQSAEGGMRDAQVALDQVLVLCRERLDYAVVQSFLGGVHGAVLDRFVEALRDRRIGDLLLLVDEVASTGLDLDKFIKNISSYLRDLVILRQVGPQSNLLDLPEDRLQKMKDLAESFTLSGLINASYAFVRLADAVKTSGYARFLLELELIRLACLDPEDDLSRLIAELKRLEQGGSTPSSPEKGSARPSDVAQRPRRQLPSSGAVSTGERPEGPDLKGSASTGGPEEETERPRLSAGVEPQIPQGPSASVRAELSFTDHDWHALVREVAGRGQPLQKALSRVKGYELAGQELVLTLCPSDRFSFDLLSRHSNREILEEILASLVGRKIGLRLQLEQTRMQPGAASRSIAAAGDSERGESAGSSVDQSPCAREASVPVLDEEEPSEAVANGEETEESSPGGDDSDLEIDYERLAAQFEAPLKGEKLSRYLEKTPEVRRWVEDLKKVFQIEDDAFSFRRHSVEE